MSKAKKEEVQPIDAYLVGGGQRFHLGKYLPGQHTGIDGAIKKAVIDKKNMIRRLQCAEYSIEAGGKTVPVEQFRKELM